MCGINGHFAYRAQALTPTWESLRATRDQMAARGPDGFGEWARTDERLKLGHRRLSIIDLSDRANQPLASSNQRLHIVFNGEIYNYRALKTALEARGAVFQTSSDTEVLLHLYAEHGPQMLTMLRGMFALAIYDDHARTLFLARDPYGIKPLYIADDGGTVHFASQVKALEAGGVDTTLDEAGLAGFLVFGHVPEPFTWRAAVRALPAGSYRLYTEEQTPKTVRYASVVEALTGSPTVARDTAQAEVAAALADSVQAHLVADVEVGLFLSAGVDSSAILGLMRDAGQDRVRAITLGFSEFAGLASDEVGLAAAVAEHYGAQHLVRRVNRAEFEADRPRIFAAMDQPTVDAVNTWFVAKAARELGLKVALSGLGGDELFGGYDSFSRIPRWVNWLGWTRFAPGLGRLARGVAETLAPGATARNPKAMGLLEYGGSYPGSYLMRRGLFAPYELGALLGEERARAALERLNPLALVAEALAPEPDLPFHRVAALEAQLYMRNQLLRDSDWAGMAHSIEIRVPLVDIHLTRACAAHLPSMVGKGKAALAAAPRKPVPRAIVDRPKTGFTVPTRAWTARTDGQSANDRLTSRRWAAEVAAEFGAPLLSSNRRALEVGP